MKHIRNQRLRRFRDDLTPGQREAIRVQQIELLGLLDGTRDPVLDELVKLTQCLCNTTYVSITLPVDEVLFLRAHVGSPSTCYSREHSFCTHTVEQGDLFLIPDTLKDPYFKKNPYVLDIPHIRFYAGVPLFVAGGAPIGALCVLHHEPCMLSGAQTDGLFLLARQIERHLRALMLVHSGEQTLCEPAAQPHTTQALGEWHRQIKSRTCGIFSSIQSNCEHLYERLDGEVELRDIMLDIKDAFMDLSRFINDAPQEPEATQSRGVLSTRKSCSSGEPVSG